jgi:hypothetical protein
MSTIINATTTNGVVIQPDNSGSLVLQTNSGTTALTIDTSQRAAFVAGTAALPAITTTGDTNTGIWFPSADTIAFAEGGAEAMRITSDGNVGIGTASPGAPLTVASSTTLSAGSPSVVLQGESNRERIAIFSAGAGNGTPVFFVASARGTIASPTAVLSGDALGYYQFGGHDSVGYVRSAWVQGIAAENYSATNRGSHLTFNTTPIASTTIAERMRIDSSGNVLVGCTATPSASVKGTGFITDGTAGTDLYIGVNSTASDRVVWCYNPNGLVGGIVLSGSATAYNTSSDYRLKENIAPMTGALDKVALLKPVTYKWKVDGSNGEGFIAHELAEVVPQAVTGEKDAVNEDGSIDPQGIDTSFLVATLTAAIQEQQTIINDLKARVETLEGAKLG